MKLKRQVGPRDAGHSVVFEQVDAFRRLMSGGGVARRNLLMFLPKALQPKPHTSLILARWTATNADQALSGETTLFAGRALPFTWTCCVEDSRSSRATTAASAWVARQSPCVDGRMYPGNPSS